MSKAKAVRSARNMMQALREGTLVLCEFLSRSQTGSALCETASSRPPRIGQFIQLLVTAYGSYRKTKYRDILCKLWRAKQPIQFAIHGEASKLYP